jgi:hypothetical protein
VTAYDPFNPPPPPGRNFWREYLEAAGLADLSAEQWRALPVAEDRRISRNYLRWKKRRTEHMRGILRLRITKDGRLVRVGPNGERWRAW